MSGDPFKEVQTRHRKAEQLMLSEIIDFSNPTGDERIISTGRTFGLSTHPGFTYAPEALSQAMQQDLSYLALAEYCEQPHRTNISAVPPKPNEVRYPNTRIWSLWKDQNGFEGKPATGKNDQYNGKKRPRDDKGHKLRVEVKHYRSPKKLSWATLGYHYDWTARTYTEDARSPVPHRLAQLATRLAGMVQSSEVHKDCPPNQFVPSAAIVNYYNTKQIMGGHRDDLEFTFSSPVISISLGLPAIFLLGGNSREVLPVAILIRPGDVMFLGGESRLAYHGIAKVIAADVGLPRKCENGTLEKLQIDAWSHGDPAGNATPGSDREALHSFLSQHRININIRQVLPSGIDRISEDMRPPLPD